MDRRTAGALTMGLVGLTGVLLWALWPAPEVPTALETDPTPAQPPEHDDPEAPVRAASPAPDPDPADAATGPATVRAAMGTLGAEAVVQCPAPDVGEVARPFTPPGPTPPVLDVRDGMLTAAVWAPEGEVTVMDHLHELGTLSWRDGGCTFEPVEWVEFEARVLLEGEPVADVPVRGCAHGRVVRSGPDGRVTLQRPLEGNCWPMAFREGPDGAFGKSRPVEVNDATPGPVVIELPPDDALWSREQQLEQVPQLAGLTERTADHLNRHYRPAFDRALASAPGEEAADLVRSWDDAWQERHSMMQQDLSRMRSDDPEEALAAMQEAWRDEY